MRKAISLCLMLVIIMTMAVSAQAEKYSPGDRPEFILTHDYKYAMKHFLVEPKLSGVVKDGTKYSLMKGYFESDGPPTMVLGIFPYHKVVMENGDVLYYKMTPDADIDSLFTEDQIQWYSDYKAAMDEKGKPLVPGSSVVIKDYNPHWRMVILADGTKHGLEKITQIRRFVSTLKRNQVRIAEALLAYDLEYHKFDDKFFIKDNTGCKTNVSVYLGRMGNDVWGRLKIRYHADSWLFIDQFGVLADDYRYTSPVGAFERFNSDSIWEYRDESLEGEYGILADKIAGSRECIIRFQGSRGIRDFTVPKVQKKKMREALDLLALIRISI